MNRLFAEIDDPEGSEKKKFKKNLYAKTIIYKIYCKNEKQKEIYVGHTTNITVRTRKHKSDCNNDKKPMVYV
jgi:hypothetical protein